MPKDILFVCVENAGRSQIAEAFFRKFTEGKYNVVSAGTFPTEKLNPIVVEVMKEIGIDITKQLPKRLSNSMVSNSHKTVNMGCMEKESCPALFVKEVINWDIPDAKRKTLEQVRVIRDQIKSEVLNLIESIDNEK